LQSNHRLIFQQIRRYSHEERINFGRNGIAIDIKGLKWHAGINWRVSGKLYRRLSHPGWENPPLTLPMTLIVTHELYIVI
jgi:hypothetical protein